MLSYIIGHEVAHRNTGKRSQIARQFRHLSIVGPLLWEYSRKSGPTLCFFIKGVLPEALQHFCGSTPAKSGIALTGVLPQTQNK